MEAKSWIHLSNVVSARGGRPYRNCTERRTKQNLLPSEAGHAHLKEIHNRKGDLEHKARLGRMLWLQLLDPIDQIHFHIIAFNTGVNFLNKLAKSMSSTERENLRIRIEEIIEKLSELTNILA